MADDKEASARKGKELQVVVFKLADETFGLEIGSVLEISRMLEITRIPEAPGFIEGVVNLRGRIIAVVDLGRQMGLESGGGSAGAARIIVVEAGGETVGLRVDQVEEVARVAEEEIEPTPEAVRARIGREYARGIAKEGERLIALLDLHQILTPQEAEAAGRVGEEHGQSSDRG